MLIHVFIVNFYYKLLGNVNRGTEDREGRGKSVCCLLLWNGDKHLACMLEGSVCVCVCVRERERENRDDMYVRTTNEKILLLCQG